MKDWVIIIAMFALLLCLFEIRRLKKLLTQHTKRMLIPQLNCELLLDEDAKKSGIYLTNESYFLVRGIKFDDAAVTINDSGYNVGMILKFEEIETLRPQEKMKLKLKVFDKEGDLESRMTEVINLHLTNASFKIKIHYSNIEEKKFFAVFSKKGEKFYLQSTQACA